MSLGLPTSSWRVKVYELLEEEWVDRGTGYCYGELVDDDKAARIVVKNEQNEQDILLRSTVQGDTQYQKQQDTLIVWTEPNKNDVALSFQEVEGCSNLCDFLVYIQNTKERNISILSVITTDDETEYTELIAGPVKYPPTPPTLDNLDEVIECLSLSVINAFYKDLMIKFILESSYIDEVLRLFGTAERKQTLGHLYNLCRVVKILFLMNDNTIFEVLLKSENIMTIIGILEYDPDFPNHKLNYRDYLESQTKFNEVVPIQDEAVRLKIMQTFKLQFLKDNILIRLLDDNIFSMLSSMIYFNQLEIIQHFQNSDDYFKRLFDLYGDRSFGSTPPAPQVPQPSEDVEKRRDTVRFIHNLSLVIKNFQTTQRNALYGNLIKNGLFRLIDFALNDTESNSTKILGTELMISILNQDVNLLVQPNDTPNDDPDDHFILLFNVLVNLLKNDGDINLKSQICDILKNLFELSTFHINANKTTFITSFENIAVNLFKPLKNLSQDDKLKTNSVRNTLYQHLADMLFFFLQHHQIYAMAFIKKHNLFTGIRILSLQHPSNLVRLSALKCIKQSFMMNNMELTQTLLDHDMLLPLINIINKMRNRNNLIHSACLEFFSSLSFAVLSNVSEIPKSTLLLLKYLMEHHGDNLAGLQHMNIYTSLKTRYRELESNGHLAEYEQQQQDVDENKESDNSETHSDAESTIIKQKGSLKRYQSLDISDYTDQHRPQKRRVSKEDKPQENHTPTTNNNHSVDSKNAASGLKKTLSSASKKLSLKFSRDKDK
jgi:protein phosphatase-4 regulatory subunit 3